MNGKLSDNFIKKCRDFLGRDILGTTYFRAESSRIQSTLVATSADSVPSSNLVRITIAPIGTTFGNLQ